MNEKIREQVWIEQYELRPKGLPLFSMSSEQELPYIRWFATNEFKDENNIKKHDKYHVESIHLIETLTKEYLEKKHNITGVDIVSVVPIGDYADGQIRGMNYMVRFTYPEFE